MSSGIVVKRTGTDQPFDERKLYASLIVSLRVSGHSEKESEVIADDITKTLSRWLGKKTHVTSHDIRLHAAHHLDEYSKLAGYIYKHHRVMS